VIDSQRLDELLAPPTDLLVKAFFDPKETFAGLTFDTLGTNTPDRLGFDDLVAVSLLDVAFAPKAVRSMFNEDADRISTLLRNIPVDLDLWDATDEQLKAASELYLVFYGYGGLKRTKASKLMARKRPRLIPIIDSVVTKLLPSLGDKSLNSWHELRSVLQDPSRRDQVETLRPDDLGPEGISTLRLLDTALWMRGSHSKPARKCRDAVGLPNDQNL
jgi:Family of unknown function (DUF6308)